MLSKHSMTVKPNQFFYAFILHWIFPVSEKMNMNWKAFVTVGNKSFRTLSLPSHHWRDKRCALKESWLQPKKSSEVWKWLSLTCRQFRLAWSPSCQLSRYTCLKFITKCSKSVSLQTIMFMCLFNRANIFLSKAATLDLLSQYFHYLHVNDFEVHMERKFWLCI